mmetsp:Transcript_6053/g.18608  ORF Transcript_6053/g.18608 Transcript_6053/m.18608 type:complete len:148 (+) Transcript_6053:651-1094(+)
MMGAEALAANAAGIALGKRERRPPSLLLERTQIDVPAGPGGGPQAHSSQCGAWAREAERYRAPTEAHSGTTRGPHDESSYAGCKMPVLGSAAIGKNSTVHGRWRVRAPAHQKGTWPSSPKSHTYLREECGPGAEMELSRRAGWTSTA